MNTKELTEKFETEVWLYLSGELSNERKAFWDDKINQIPELKNIFNESVNLNELSVEELDINQISDEKYESIITDVITTKQNVYFGEFLKRKSIDQNISNAKVIFTIAAIAATIIIFIMLPGYPEKIEKSFDKLAWNSQPVDSQIASVNESFQVIRERTFDRELLNSYSIGNWDNKLENIYSRIKNLEKKINYETL